MGGLLSTMKYETYTEYDPRRTALAESAFLTLWPALDSWHKNLVLVGGLVPKYLCGDDTQHHNLPRPATLDVDLGIALGTDSGQYGNLFWELSGQGFKKNATNESRLEKTIGDFTVYVDFLVEHPPRIEGTANVEEITANIMPGINRALVTARTIEVRGVDLHGARQSFHARVCEVGPFLALKLRAFCNRQQPKDAFDILYTLQHYDKGTDAAIAAFREEVSLGNPACADALHTLNTHFQNEDAPGRVKASTFVLGQVIPGESEDTRFRRATLKQEMVDAATKLLQEAIK